MLTGQQTYRTQEKVTWLCSGNQQCRTDLSVEKNWFLIDWADEEIVETWAEWNRNRWEWEMQIDWTKEEWTEDRTDPEKQTIII